MKKRNQNQGFTFIEMILYVGLVSIFITGAVIFAWNVINTRAKSSIEQQVLFNSRLVSKRIAFEIRNASSVTSVTPTVLTLANADSARNPTVIDLTGGRIRIGWGATGSCPTSSPCFLTGSNVIIQSINFVNYSSGSLSNNVRFELVTKSSYNGTQRTWKYSDYATVSAEVRSK